jgi:hypothetical protein
MRVRFFLSLGLLTFARQYAEVHAHRSAAIPFSGC